MPNDVFSSQFDATTSKSTRKTSAVKKKQDEDEDVGFAKSNFEMYLGLDEDPDLIPSLKRKTDSKETPADLSPVTFRHCLVVQDSWKCLTAYNSEQLGVQFFMRFFLTYPDYRNFYPKFRSDCDLSKKDVNRSELRLLKNHAELRKLAVSYVDELSSLFGSLYSLLELQSLLHHIVDRHFSRGVLHLHFQDMMSILMTFVEEKTGHDRMTSNTREAWQSARQAITTIIDDRYMYIQHKKHVRE
ncbi:hypothetical protein ACOMHN_038623 [Nucella lapillus]